MKKKTIKPKQADMPLQENTVPKVEVAEEKKPTPTDWLTDPASLYMRGMAQRREQMRQLQQNSKK